MQLAHESDLQDSVEQKAVGNTTRYAVTESFGRIAHRTAIARNSTNEADKLLRDKSQARALRALAAGGFGNANAAKAALPMRPIAFASGDSPLLYKTAGMRDLIAVAARWVSTAVWRYVDAWRRRQQVRATYLALCKLDARMLLDIGLHRSEVLSIAAEVGGEVEATRVHSMNNSVWRS